MSGSYPERAQRMYFKNYKASQKYKVTFNFRFFDFII